MTGTDPLAWYPGHCYFETLLFGRELVASQSELKLLNHVVHKRNLPNDTEKDRIIFPHTKLHICTDQTPDGSLQLIRFVGLARNAPEFAETHQDRQVLASVFSTLGFPLQHVAFALRSPRVEQGRLITGDESDINGDNSAFYATGSRFCIIWRFNSSAKTTRAVIVNYTPASMAHETGFTRSLETACQYFRHFFGHPMFLSILFVQILRLDAISLYDYDSGILSVIENQITFESANRMRTMQQLRDLGRLIGHDKFILSALQVSLKQARIFNERTYVDKQHNFKDSIGKHFLTHLEHRWDTLELDIAFLESMYENITH